MHSEGLRPNFVLFDLSKLDASSLAACLSDAFLHQTMEQIAATDRCHWVLSLARLSQFRSEGGPASRWFFDRLKAGDRLLVVSPSGRDWNHMFPVEAQSEVDAVLQAGADALFSENSPRAPEWMETIRGPVFRATTEGLEVSLAGQRGLHRWAQDGNRGVRWLVAGQILTSPLPPSPWADLLTPSQTRGTIVGAAPQSAPSPRDKIPWSQLGQLRSSTVTSSTQLPFLFRSTEFPGLGTKEAVDFDEALGGIRKRSLVANMQGQTDMKEQGLRVRFQGGRLLRIENTASGRPLCTSARSVMEWNGTRHEFAVNSAFSFEGDFSWGLRQSLVLRHDDLAEEGRAILDYYFVEESREFFVAVTVRWPRWKVPVTVQRWSVLELDLFEQPAKTPLVTRSLWPDGTSVDRLVRSEREGVLRGTDFVLGSGAEALVLGFPQNQTPRPHLLPWKRTRRWGRSSLTVSPEGGWGQRPSSEFEGVEEHFSLYLAPAEGAKLPFTVTRKQASELIPPYVETIAE